MIDWPVSSWLSSMTVILPGGCQESVGHLADHDHLVTELDDDRTKVEHHLAAVRPDEPSCRPAVARVSIRRGRELDPGLLHPRPLKRRLRSPVGAERQPARTGASPFCAGGSRSAIAASTSTFMYNASTAVFETCVRIAGSSIILCEIALKPAASSAVCATEEGSIPTAPSRSAMTVSARAPIRRFRESSSRFTTPPAQSSHVPIRRIAVAKICVLRSIPLSLAIQ